VVAIHGEDVRSPRGDLGMVFQSPVLLPWKTVLQNVLLPIHVRRQPLDSYRDRAKELLTLVGLEGFDGRYPHELSGGMQQRVGIVRALICDPDILLMDEPFGALDAITRDQLNLQLMEIWARTQKTVLFVTHGIAEAVFLSDRVLVMSARPGRVIDGFRIDLPRPRNVQQMESSVFGAAVVRIRRALELGMDAAVTHRNSPQPTVVQ
jgi:NitT/TauT family transport system ATP-binding protein